MKTYSVRPADPFDNTVLVSFDGSRLAANANPTVWALAVRWGSTIFADTAAPGLDGSQLVPARASS